MSPPLALASARLAAVAGVAHGFSIRLDDRAAFLDSVLPGLGAEGALGRRGTGDASRLVMLGQVHEARIFDVRGEDDGRTPPDGFDAVTTDRPGVALGIRTADCAPLLVADRRRAVVGAAHAGWRGAAAGIAMALVRHLGDGYGSRPEDLVAAIGPTIGACCFEVGPEVVEALARLVPTREGWAKGPPGAKAHVDLVDVNRRQLIAAGLDPQAIDLTSPCTVCDARGFASYRRDGSAAGRQLSVIALAP